MLQTVLYCEELLQAVGLRDGVGHAERLAVPLRGAEPQAEPVGEPLLQPLAVPPDRTVGVAGAEPHAQEEAVGECEGEEVADRERAAVGERGALSVRRAEALAHPEEEGGAEGQVVRETVPLGVELTDPHMLTEVEPEAERQREGEGVTEGLRSGDVVAEAQPELEGTPVALPEPVGAPLPLLHAEPQAVELALREELWQALPEMLGLVLVLPVADRLGLPLEDAQKEGLPVAVVHRVAEVHKVAALVMLAEPDADKQREAEGVAEGQSDGEADNVEQPLLDREAVPQPLPESVPLPVLLPVPQAEEVGDTEAVPHPVLLALRLPVKLLVLDSVPLRLAVEQGLEVLQAVGDCVAEVHTAEVPDLLAEPVADKQREVVGLTEGLGVEDKEAVEQPLTELEAVLQTLPEYVPEPLLLLLLQTDALGVTVDVAQPLLLALRLFVTLLVFECVPQALEETQALVVTEAVGDRVAEAHTVVVLDALTELVADKQREVEGLTDGLKDAEVEAVEQPLLENEAVPHPLPE